MRLNFIVTFLALTLVTLAYGQDTKKKSIENKTPYYKEVYYVLKSNQEVKHGEYQKYTKAGLAEKGQFENNIKAGVWEFYDYGGNLEQRFNYTSQTIEIIKPFDWIDKLWVIDEGELEEKTFDKKPCFIGGMSKIRRIWGIQYPVDARRSGISGVVIISATVTSDGKIMDEKVEHGIGYGCDEEALRAVQAIPNEWLPGKVEGANVDTRIFVPVTFKLN